MTCKFREGVDAGLILAKPGDFFQRRILSTGGEVHMIVTRYPRHVRPSVGHFCL